MFTIILDYKVHKNILLVMKLNNIEHIKDKLKLPFKCSTACVITLVG